MKFFSSYKDDGFWWFRIWGYGLAGKDLRKHFLLFSEKYGYVKTLKIGNWSIKFIKPNR